MAKSERGWRPLSSSESSLREWEQLYTTSRHLSVWPWTDVVSLTMRFANPAKGARILELGCGAGANIPFFRSLGVEYWGIDGSPTTVERLRKAYPEMHDRLIVGDFSNEIAALGIFDLILDRGSITHNSTSAVRRILAMIKERLALQGKFLGVDWFSTAFSEHKAGEPGEDRYTRVGFTKGRLAGTGVGHFSDEQHLRELLSAFDLVYLEHKTVEGYEPADSSVYAAWNFMAVPK